MLSMQPQKQSSAATLIERYKQVMSNASPIAQIGTSFAYQLLLSNQIEQFKQMTIGFEELSVEQRYKLLNSRPTDTKHLYFKTNVATLLFVANQSNEFIRLTKDFEQLPVIDRYQLLNAEISNSNHPNFKKYSGSSLWFYI